MSIGLAIFLATIIGFAIYSPGSVVAAVIALFIHQANLEHQEQEKARIEADKRQQQEAERRDIEQAVSKVCLNLNTQRQCIEDTEAACRLYWDVGKKKECIARAARWCADEGTRKQCMADALRAIADALRAQEEARRAEQARQEEPAMGADSLRGIARQAQQARHEALEAMERWRIRGGLWEWLPQDYLSRRDCPNVEKAIDRALATAR